MSGKNSVQVCRGMRAAEYHEDIGYMAAAAAITEDGGMCLHIRDTPHGKLPSELTQSSHNTADPEILELLPARETFAEDAVTEIVRKLGIPANIKGYRYIRTAVMMCMEDPALIESVTGRLYPEIARQYKTTPTRVERALRHAITVAWDRAEGDESYISKRLRCRISFASDRPTNSELIALISDSLMLEAKWGRKHAYSINS